MSLHELKAKMLELIETDTEFRYAIAGKLGMLEILKRLDKIEEEIKLLRESQNKTWEEIHKTWSEIKQLHEEQKRLSEEQRKLRATIETLGKALGATFEHYAIGFVKLMLEDLGHPQAQVDRKTLYYNGKIYEINIFCEQPLIVGEATIYLGSIEEADKELHKLIERIEIAKKVYGKEPMIKILAIANAPSNVINHLKRKALEKGIKLAYGRELEILI
ncbi:MAG: hypothetical protein ACXQTI_05120 [Candidatus Nezhaarchaeales archaeon]